MAVLDHYWRPNATVSATGWTTVGAASAHAATSEVTPSDAQYVQTYTPGASVVLNVGVSETYGQPDPAGSITVRYRVRGNGADPVRVELLQGAAVIASWLHDPAPTDWTQYAQTLTAGQREAITAPPDLRVSVIAGEV